jgi:hypothetical protein
MAEEKFRSIASRENELSHLEFKMGQLQAELAQTDLTAATLTP